MDTYLPDLLSIYPKAKSTGVQRSRWYEWATDSAEPNDDILCYNSGEGTRIYIAADLLNGQYFGYKKYANTPLWYKVVPNYKNSELRLQHKLDIFYNNVILVEQTDTGFLWSVEIHPLTKKKSTGKEQSRFGAERQCYKILKKALPLWIQNYLRSEGYM